MNNNVLKKEVKLCPIVLFTHKRLDTLQKTIDSLKLNTLAIESELFIFSDGTKGQSDKEGVENVRAFLKTITGFKKIIIKESPCNKGLANSVISGVTEVINLYGKVIVLEDDLQATPNFLQFMNQSIEYYTQNKNVFSISGYAFDLSIAKDETFDSYFLNRGWSWGWATWKDRWENVDWKVKSYKAFTKNKVARKNFALGGSDLNKMLDDYMKNDLDSWAIRWFYHQFSNNGLTVYPIYSKIQNNGFGEEATHTKGSYRRYIPYMGMNHKKYFNHPEIAEISTFYQQMFIKKMGYWSRFISKIQTILNI